MNNILENEGSKIFFKNIKLFKTELIGPLTPAPGPIDFLIFCVKSE